MHVLICHGKESSPASHKLTVLKVIAEEHGHTAEIPDLRDFPDNDHRLKHLMGLFPDDKPTAIVGSSMGGWLAVLASRVCPVTGLFLLAPALDIPGYTNPEPMTTTLYCVHGLLDDVVPFKNSVAMIAKTVGSSYRSEAGLSCIAHLTLATDDHRLHASLPEIKDLFRMFLRDCAEVVAAERGVL